MTDAALTRVARTLQTRLESFYELEAGPDVQHFVEAAPGGARETLLVRVDGDSVRLGLMLPEPGDSELDRYVQIVEGVSHFVYLAERARIDLPATELELELQAEVDKFVILAFEDGRLDSARAASVHRALFDDVSFLDGPDTERGHRYRLASALAARFSRRLFTRARNEVEACLRRFYRAGQTDKLRLANA